MKLNQWSKKKNNFQQTKNSGPDVIIYEFYQIFREELTSILLKLFQKKIAEEGILPNSFYVITLKPKSKIPQEKENYTQISLKIDAKCSKKY